ncbi:MAG: pyrimidine-nucleoside phosphorylase [Lachnospiraceae bacterium]|nr:pyrimidine-nucleoside phosphorylase [Lachnospiraceae bacterium]
MRMYDLIMKKRNNAEHSKEEIRYIIDKFTKGEIPDYQMSAWLMSVYFNGMTKEETLELTNAMADSGDRLDLSKINGVKVDKHSTGGVGDKTTFIVAPILASLGIPMAKMSGRGLGHTGGTIDKLEAIEGFNVAISEEDFINNVNNIKLSLVGQTGNLAPADKKIYALRDVTATVDSLPLIASSIMSKKLAAGADVIVLDVKCGSGAFMKDEASAKELAKTMVEIGNGAGRKTYGIITDMNEPLGCKVGNALEVYEAVEVLKLKNLEDVDFGIKRLLEVSLTLASYMLMGAKKYASDETLSYEEARKICEEAITSGKALDKFAEFAAAQGGDSKMLYNPELLPKAKYIVPVYASKEGYVASCKTSEVGMVSLILGGGRETKESIIDLAVGIDIRKHIGDYVKTDEVFAYIHADDEAVIKEAEKRLLGAYEISDEKIEPEKIIKYVSE